MIERNGRLQGCPSRIVRLKDLLRFGRPGLTIDGLRDAVGASFLEESLGLNVTDGKGSRRQSPGPFESGEL